MSLSYDLSKIRDYKTTCWIGRRGQRRAPDEPGDRSADLRHDECRPGFASLTRTWTSLSHASASSRRSHGAMLYKVEDGERVDWFLSDEDFVAHIGLACNVSSESRSKWANRLFVAKQTSKTESLAGMFHNKRMDIEKAALR